jgi:hypothetical protein
MIAHLFSEYVRECEDENPLSISQFVHSSVLSQIDPECSAIFDDLIQNLIGSLSVVKQQPQDFASAQRYQSRAFRKKWAQSSFIVRGSLVNLLDLGSGPGQVGFVLSQKIKHYKDPRINIKYFPVDKNMDSYRKIEAKSKVFITSMMSANMLNSIFFDDLNKFEFDLDQDLTYNSGQQVRALIESLNITHISAYNFLQHVQPRGVEVLCSLVEEYGLYFSAVVPSHDLYEYSTLKFLDNEKYPLRINGGIRPPLNEEEQQLVWGISRKKVEIEELGEYYEEFYYTTQTWDCFKRPEVLPALQVIHGMDYWTSTTSDPVLDVGEVMRRTVLIWHKVPDNVELFVELAGMYEQVQINSQASEVDVDTIKMIVSRMHTNMASTRPKKNGVLVYLDGDYAVDRRGVAFTLPIYLRGYAELMMIKLEGEMKYYLHLIKVTQYQGFRVHTDWSNFLTWFCHPLTDDCSGFFETETIKPDEVLEGLVIHPKEKILSSIDEFYVKPYPVADLRINQVAGEFKVENFPEMRVMTTKSIDMIHGGIYEMVILRKLPGTTKVINVCVIIGRRYDKNRGENYLKAQKRIDFYEVYQDDIKLIYSKAGAFYPSWTVYVREMRRMMPAEIRKPGRRIKRSILWTKTN